MAAAVAAWSGSFSGPFVFDDRSSILDNPSLRQLWPPDWLTPPAALGETVGGRPLLNLTFALNFAAGDIAVRGYHATNLAIHVLAGLTLFGLVRRTLVLPRIPPEFATAATPLATAVAGLWLLHPLQTAAVTYVVQRAESLAGLFYLLTLYSFLRASASDSPRRWAALAVVAGCLGMAVKETVATVPVVVLLFDRCFIAGSFRGALRSRGRLHAALAGTWFVLAFLVLRNAGRGGSAGFGSAVGVGPYLLTQCDAIVRYLGLALWPRSLVFDYGTATVAGLHAVLPQALLVLALLGGAGYALHRRWAAGFLGAAFFLLLAPSSSIVPVATQTMAEHRMYLPLAAVLAGAVLLARRFLGRGALLPCALAGIALGPATWTRNRDYRSERVLWLDTLAKRPDNARAHNNLGIVLREAGDAPAALEEFQRAVALDPNLASAHSNLGSALVAVGRPAEAVAFLRAVLALNPGLVSAHINLGNALVASQQPAEAERQFREALRLEPTADDARANLAAVLLDRGATDDALTLFSSTLAGRHENAETHYQYGKILLRAGRSEAGLEELRRAIQLRPALIGAHFALGNALAGAGDFPGAIAAYRRVLALDPAHFTARNNLANALLVSGRPAEAIPEYETILRQQPANRAVRDNLDYARQLLQGTAAP